MTFKTRIARLWRQALACLAIGLLCANQGKAAAPGGAPSPCLQGTFIQLVDANRDWSRAQWEALFAQMHALQISTLVLQWSVIDNQAFYPTGSFKSSQAPVVEWILGLADDYKMSVMVGLAHKSNHWSEVAKPELREKYLTDELAHAALVAAQLKPIVSKYPAFKGWYISEEIDDLNWVSQGSYETLCSYLLQITTLLKTLTPGARIGISAFANGTTPPATVGLFWNSLLQKVRSLDIVYFQDGVGVHKLPLERLPAYYAAVQKAAQAHHREMQPVVELFEQTGGLPGSESAFAAVPAPMQRITRQLAIAEQYSTRRISFSVPEYLSAAGGPAALSAFDSYHAHLLESHVACN